MPQCCCNSLAAVAVYTYDTQTGRESQLYFHLNRMLRVRGEMARASLIQTWGGFMHHFMKALAKLPDVAGTCYRGYPDKPFALKNYEHGVPFQWGAFTSTTTSLEVAKSFTDRTTGALFKITVWSGRDIRRYSFFSAEEEILLSPNHRFMVTSTPYVVDGFTMIDILQRKSAVFYS